MVHGRSSLVKNFEKNLSQTLFYGLVRYELADGPNGPIDMGSNDPRLTS